jgi:YgiT-type zinc finger domain-containing protein
MQPASVPYYYEENGRRWLFENVPALVCDLCGRTTFDPSVAARIQSIIIDGGEPTCYVTMPVYDFGGTEPRITRSTRVA